MGPTSPTGTGRPRGVTVGLTLFVVGLVAVVVDVLPFFAGDHNTPLWLNLTCLLAPAGLVTAVWSAVRQGRARQRAALAALAERPPIH